jgi:hypothetical protein
MRLTHVHIFLMGWTYYLGIPVITAYLGLLDSVELAGVWLKFVDTSGTWKWALPLYTVLMPIAFVFGDRLSRLIKRPKPRFTRVRFANWVLLPIYASLLLLFTVSAKELLFAGYVQGYDPSLMGPIATLQMMILFQYFLFKSSGIRTAARLNMALLIVCSIILLSMGGRLYVISSLAAIYFYYWNWSAKDDPERRRSLVFALVVLIVLAVIGMLRMGIFDAITLIFYLFTEPFFTSISAFSIMQNGEWSLLETPKEFFFAFVNIVPSALWPDKATFFSELTADSLAAESPFGALSIVASTVRNFGFVGGLIFISTVGFFMGKSLRNAASPIGMALYCYLISLLPFIFFRDPFSVQVKLVLTGFLLAWFYKMVSSLLTPGHTTAAPKFI